MTLLIVSVCVALSVSALCSLLEAALLSLPAGRISAMAAKRPAAGAIWRRFKERIERPIAVILIVNTAAHTIGATIAGARFELVFGEGWLLAFSLAFTFLMLQFTEILPKTLGVRYNAHLAPIMARPLDLTVKALTPLLWLIHAINRPFERREAEADTSLEELTALAATARLTKTIDSRQERMIVAASRFDELKVRQIMTPRTELIYLRLDQPVEQILDVVQNSPYTRLPLCERDIDHVVGMIHVKDLFNHLDLVPGRLNVADVILAQGRTLPSAGPLPGTGLHVIGSGNIDLRKIRRDVPFIPEYTPVLQALRRFQETRTHLAIVVDEYGSTQGVVTMEDVLEEVVGDIEDEFDPPTRPMVVEENGGYRVSGRFPIHDLVDHVPFAEVDAEGVDTVGGYVAKILGKMPETGETIPWGPYTVRVTAADQRRVSEVRFEPVDPAQHTGRMADNGAEDNEVPDAQGHPDGSSSGADR